MGRTKYFLVIFILFFILGNAQNRKKELDSLMVQAKSLPDDTLKAKVLSRIHERMMFMDAEKAKDFAQQAFELSKKIGYEKGVGNGYLQFGNYYYNQSKNDSAEVFHNLALKKFMEIKSVRGQIFAMHSLATIEREKGNYDGAIVLTKSILDMYNDGNRKNSDLGKFDLRGSEYEVLGEIYFEKGSYKIALEQTLMALRFFEDISDEVRTADALKQLADIEFQLKNYSSSIEYAEKAIDIYRKNDDKVYLSYAKNTAGLSAEKLGNITLSENYFKESIALAREMNVQSMISQSLNDLARLYYSKGEYIKSRTLLNESLEISNQQDIKLDQTEALQEIANLDLKQGSLEQALSNINKAISISKSIGALPTLRDAIRTRAEIRNAMNQYSMAYQDYEEYHSLSDSIYDSRKSQQIEELKTIYETDKKEAEIALQEKEIHNLNQEVQISNLRKGMYAGGMASALVLSGLLVFGFRQRMKKNRIAREKQEEIYKQEIAYKKKELASQTLHLVQKNTFIQELMENLQRIKNSPEKFKMEFRRIVMLLKKENASDKDWEVFKTYFSEVHNDFDQKLKTISPDVSEKEIRLAAFLRMNLTTKEIAATLNVLPDSILKSKYRLKKKLELDKETDLTTFLNTM